MTYNEKLGNRVDNLFREKKIKFELKKMFGGLCFLVKGKMCLGVVEEKLMLRIDPDIYTDLLKEKGCSEMVFTGKPMKGFIYVSSDVLKKDKQLEKWMQYAIDFNPKAKSSKKK